MDLFKSNGPDDFFWGGQSITGYESAMWVERYRQAGDFEIVAKLSSGLDLFLPVGTLISHTKTFETCIVENIEITETSTTDPILKISGRSFFSFLENRIVGLELAKSTDQNPTTPFKLYEVVAGTGQAQIKTIIDEHLDLDNVVCTIETGLPTTVQEKLSLPRGTVYDAILDILPVANLGLRTIRKNTNGAFNSLSTTKTLLHIHKGNDKRWQVIFSWENNELESASYLTSLKSYKNVALVQGTYFEKIVYDTPVAEKYDRRVMIVSATDIDAKQKDNPTQAEYDAILAKLVVRGKTALAKQRLTDISNTDISKITTHRYRIDYDIGDIVTVSGKYDLFEQRRVVEHVEIEDENGETSYPTFESLRVEEYDLGGNPAWVQ